MTVEESRRHECGGFFFGPEFRWEADPNRRPARPSVTILFTSIFCSFRLLFFYFLNCETGDGHRFRRGTYLSGPIRLPKPGQSENSLLARAYTSDQVQ